MQVVRDYARPLAGAAFDQLTRAAEEQMPPAVRERTLAVVLLNSPYYVDHLSPAELAEYRRMQKHVAAIERAGLNATLVGAPLESPDYVDRTHLSVTAATSSRPSSPRACMRSRNASLMGSRSWQPSRARLVVRCRPADCSRAPLHALSHRLADRPVHLRRILACEQRGHMEPCTVAATHLWHRNVGGCRNGPPRSPSPPSRFICRADARNATVPCGRGSLRRLETDVPGLESSTARD